MARTEFKLAVVTGAASGIGLSLCKKLLNDGTDVIALDLDKAGLEKLELESKKYGHKLTPVVQDVTDLKSFEKLIKGFESEKKKIDLFIPAAGINGIGEFTEQSSEEFMKCLDINLLSVIRQIKIVVTHMSQNGFGSIGVISSVAGHVASPMMSSYCTGKHALVGFTRSLQAEFALQGTPVKLTLISPGFVDTKIIKKGEAQGFPEWMTPILAKPESVAEEILNALKKGISEVAPTLNGKAMLALNRLFPKLLPRQSKLMLAKSWKDIFLNRYNS